MAKQKLRLTLSGDTVSAPIWLKEEIHWENNGIGCPLCSVIRKPKPIMDVLQYGMIDYDLCITVMSCRACKRNFGIKYTIPHGIGGEIENGADNA